MKLKMKRMKELRYRRFYADKPIDPQITANCKKAPNGAFFMRIFNMLFEFDLQSAIGCLWLYGNVSNGCKL